MIFIISTNFQENELQRAMKDLTGSGLRMWLYLKCVCEKPSPHVCAAWGIKKSSYYRSLKELVSKGFIEALPEG